MTTEHKDCSIESRTDLSRREFVALSLAAGLAIASVPASGADLPLVETDVNVKTPGGICDEVFMHRAKRRQSRCFDLA